MRISGLGNGRGIKKERKNKKFTKQVNENMYI
jgi:hypothetical protein